MRNLLIGLLAAGTLLTGTAVADPQGNPDLIDYRHPWIVKGVVHDYSTGLVSVTTDNGATLIMGRPLLHWVVRPRSKDVMIHDGMNVVLRFPRKEKFRVVSRNNDTVVLGTYKGVMIVPASVLPPDDHDAEVDYDEWDADVLDSDGQRID